MKLRRRVAAIRRQVERLAAIAAERAVQAEYVPRRNLRPLSEAESEALVGAELLAALGGARRRD